MPEPKDKKTEMTPAMQSTSTGDWNAPKDVPQKDDPNQVRVAVTGERLDKKAEKGTPEEEDAKKILARMQTGSPWSVTEEENEKLLKSVVTEEKKDDDDNTVITKSISKDEAEKATTTIASIPKYQNETQNLTGVAGEEDLTRGGTLNNDRSKKMKMSLEDLNKEIEKTAGPNPIPNREGNELTKAMQGFRPENTLMVNRLTRVIDEVIAGGKLNKEDEQKIKEARERI